MGIYNVHGVSVDSKQAFVNVREYGAKGDGIVDDTQAIQNAINAVRESGGIVFIPNGTYLLNNMLWNSSDEHVSTCLMLFDNVTLELENGATLLRGDTVNHMIFTYNNNDAIEYDGAKNIVIRGGIIDENGSLNSNDTAVNLSHAFNVLIENVTFKNASGSWHYIEVNSSKKVLIRNCVFMTGNNVEDIQLDAAIGAGNIGMDDGSVCRNIEIAQCYFNTGSHPAIGNHSDYAHEDIRIHDCIFYNNNSRGAIDFVASTKNVDAYNNTFYQNQRAIGFGASQLSSTFHDNRLTNVTTPVLNCTAYSNVIDGVYSE